MDVRRVQLAARIGRLFEEYTYSRGDMLAAWRGEDVAPWRPSGVARASARAHAETEAWQRRLWLAMFGEGGLARRRSPARSDSRPFSRCTRRWPRSPPRDGRPPARAPRLRLRARRARLPRAPRAHRARDRGRRLRAQPLRGLLGRCRRRRPAPLHLWGGPGASTCARSTRSPASTTTTASSIRSAPAGSGRARSCTGSRATSCAASPRARPSTRAVRLERRPQRRSSSSTRASAASCEAVASEIWRLVEADETLRFDEIAVLVPRSGRGPVRRAGRRRSSARPTICRTG